MRKGLNTSKKNMKKKDSNHPNHQNKTRAIPEKNTKGLELTINNRNEVATDEEENIN
ncbi:hypothetical protein [Companilactobacillus zhongbaensis]|uniref:hypothetical protein n=1 Tax=Companilactobacillus zhongbaensis TaxID=2486009 RepID=UPI0013DE37F2|nr:hypothetical protein [Companilactobacillus zhongbaensis]